MRPNEEGTLFGSGMSKRRVILIVLGLLVSLLAAACGTPTPEPVQLPEPTDGPAIPPTDEPLGDPVVDYLEEVNPHLLTWGESLTQIEVLLSAARENRALMFDDEWRLDMHVELAKVHFANMRLVEVDWPEEVEEPHRALMEVVVERETMVVLMTEGVDEGDWDLIRASLIGIERAMEHMATFMTLLDAIP